MSTKFRAGRYGKGIFWWTLLLILLTVGGGVALFFVHREGNALAVWYCCIVGSLFLLALFASPSGAVVSEQSVEVRGVLRSEFLLPEEIRSVRLVEWSSLGRVLPLGGVAGFLGYYGKFYSTARRQKVELSVRSRQSLVEICTKSRCYILSLSKPEEFIDAVDLLRSGTNHFENQTK